MIITTIKMGHEHKIGIVGVRWELSCGEHD
jgi:hypothetical protein